MGVGVRDCLFLAVVLGGTGILGAGLVRMAGAPPAQPIKQGEVRSDLHEIVTDLDRLFHEHWTDQKLVPAARAADLAVMRRLALVLCGTVPSLEEIRRFESRPRESRVEAWLDDLLADRRCADYLAERFARAYVGTEDGPFIKYRRRRFVTWLSDAFVENRPYDALVRDLIASQGLWTDHPATNFVSVTVDPELERPTPDRLAARVARAFLGARIDCAQCHDHPFQPWKQADFRSLAAFFGGVHADLRGIRDGENDYQPPDRKTKEPVKVEPQVPFSPDLLPESGSPRERLAAWVVDARNPNFARATVNRVWALVLGRPLAEPVDDLRAAGELHPALGRLADDFAAHGYNLHRLIRVIAATEVFQLDSAVAETPSGAQEEAWAVFPMTRLRPEQVAGALFQSSSLSTLGAQSHWFIRMVTYTGRNDFVRRYGDTGEDEFDSRGGTIPQRLVLMNGDIVRDKIKGDFFTAPGRIAGLARDDRAAVETAFLTVLTRRPSPEEESHFTARLAGTTKDVRKERLTDLFWALINTTEFSWNH
jgi:Protein of unknown function (DUF1549)/Protein of unknown function (DUF1553)